jgi:hypothetical protein
LLNGPRSFTDSSWKQTPIPNAPQGIEHKDDFVTFSVKHETGQVFKVLSFSDQQHVVTDLEKAQSKDHYKITITKVSPKGLAQKMSVDLDSYTAMFFKRENVTASIKNLDQSRGFVELDKKGSCALVDSTFVFLPSALYDREFWRGAKKGVEEGARDRVSLAGFEFLSVPFRLPMNKRLKAGASWQRESRDLLQLTKGVVGAR